LRQSGRTNPKLREAVRAGQLTEPSFIKDKEYINVSGGGYICVDGLITAAAIVNNLLVLNLISV